MTFNFPESASNGQTYTASNGRVYRYNGLTWVIDSVSTISNISEQFLSINGDGVVTGSSQLTSSFDERYVLSGSITQTTWDNIENKPAGIVSESTDLSSLNGFTSSYFTDSSSFDSRISTEMGRIDAILSASDVDKDSFAEIVALINSVDTTNDSNFASFYTSSNARIQSLENSTSSFETIGRGIVSGSSQLTSSLDTRYTLSGSSVNINTSSFATTGSNSFSGSQTITGSLIVSAVAVVSGGISVPTGSILSLTSGSSISVDSSGAITGSLTGSVFGIGDVVAFSASLNSRIINGSSVAGTVSGSSQLTSSFDGRYVQTGSFNSLTASFNSFTASGQSVTTGSNSFNGTQIITGSLIITTGSFVGSQILANTSSLYLTSGSNLYVQNNGLVEITGSVNITGSVRIAAGGGFEGGELALAYAPSGSTLTGSAVSIDIYQNRLRIFENGGSFRGSYLNMTSQSSGVASEIVTSTNISSIQTITSASYAALTPVSGTLYIIIG